MAADLSRYDDWIRFLAELLDRVPTSSARELLTARSRAAFAWQDDALAQLA